MVNLLLIRHGESEANAERRFTRHDHEPLTAVGVAQAIEAGRRLATSYAPVAVYASPYERSLDTARYAAMPFGLDPVVVEPLREQSFGEFKGMPYEAFYDIHGDQPESVERWFVSAPGGESLAVVRDRVGPALDQIARAHPGEQVLVVSHGGVMAALRAYVRGHFDEPPESTPNAWGYRVEARISSGQASIEYRGPLDL